MQKTQRDRNTESGGQAMTGELFGKKEDSKTFPNDLRCLPGPDVLSERFLQEDHDSGCIAAMGKIAAAVMKFGWSPGAAAR